jgi:UDP-3-O-[3-hydroxymyristoyl] glucosamine N-acyltransferase
MNLSVLKNATKDTITYYVGSDVNHISHLKDCTVVTKQEFVGLDNVKFIITDNPQLYFYKLSHQVKDIFTFNGNYTVGENCNIHPSSVIGDGVYIKNNVTVGPNTVIYSNTIIEDGVRIDANVTIGTEGMMWVWENDKKVFLKQLGGVKIGENSIIGSNSVIVRGSANEYTTLEEGVNLAPGCCIGHGTYIGHDTHFAKNVTIGGSVYISPYNFIGSGAIINPGVKINNSDVVIGSGSTVTKDIIESGVYVGLPAKRYKNTTGKLNGIPYWRQ